jgi:uncharacterized protein (DUF305 family)
MTLDPPPATDLDDGEEGADGDGGDGAEGHGPVAAWVGSDRSMVWLKRISMGLALAFLVGAMGYVIGVRTTVPPGNDVDAGFLQDMTDHHDQAVRLALTELANGTDPVARGFATEVVMFQRQELGRMQNFQEEIGAKPAEYDPERTTMAWMGMGRPLKDMNGMATEAQLEQLERAKGAEADKLFLKLMQTHHQGGAHMADYEVEHGANPKIREMAERMAANQRTEAREYQAEINRLEGK